MLPFLGFLGFAIVLPFSDDSRQLEAQVAFDKVSSLDEPDIPAGVKYDGF